MGNGKIEKTAAKIHPSYEKQKEKIEPKQVRSEELSPEDLAKVKEFAEHLIRGFTLIGVRRPYIAKKYVWTKQRDKILHSIVDNILQKNKFFEGCNLARKETVAAVCNKIESHDELGDLFSKKIETIIAQMKDLAQKKIA